MSEPLELQTQKPYALDQLTQLQSQIMQSAQGMVVQRARIEKYRQSNLTAARDTYTELERIRAHLVERLTASQLFLLEMEEYPLASAAEQLRRGLAGFQLMSTGYKPVYEALAKFTASFPTGQKTNAAIVGRLMNNIKLGYYPTDPDNISLILRGIHFPEGVTTNLFDPCCGCGKALRQLAQGNNCYAYGVELDESRAEEAQTRLHRVGFGSFFHSRISHEAFHLLFLNPPYLSVINESGGRSRHEKRFLIESIPTLMYGGLLIYVIPYYRLTPDICRVLVDNFDGLTVWRFTDSEFKKFKQVAVLGIRKKRDTELQDTLWLEQLACSPAGIPLLTQLPESRYALPAQPMTVNTFKGERFNQKELEQQLRKSDSFAQMMARSELDSGVKHPLLPLSISQIGLIGGSGMINGLIECDTPHIIKGRIVKVVRTESEEKFSARGNHMGSEIRETITNKMIFNVLTPNGFKALT
ncbi:MAG: SAM-dependent methyltransferase [Clostridiales bacterium 52_15]|nr:MAG: SAM-dependent methyltransferase [Clostridiales bacterium 52_15]